ncbi:MAG: ATP phosphoribosyltransferase [Phycisphaerae bacterium]|nr:ATP phosphoribosyltransferase [Phycisphaerae bacterium]MBM92305.1 ATP phosphoribosyltransferase [Phycisphaerae bacterium]|tara:strand:+ start:696 stop:1571 length:876 start_codon:yes stop_codon:yes gene_type:complete
MTPIQTDSTIKLAIPKGRMFDGVSKLMRDAGIRIRTSSRDYRPTLSLPGFDVKILKPRAVIEMLDLGARDLGFAGEDWVREDDADLVELLDTGLDRVRLVAAIPERAEEDEILKRPGAIVASEYVNLSKRWIQKRGENAKLIRSYGATEVLPPEDADCIIDNTATGATLEANNLRIIDELMVSTTRLYASRAAMEDPAKREQIERFTLLIRSVLEARVRVMLELNVSSENLAGVIEVLPCMRTPTVAPMHNNDGFAVKVAVPREQLTQVIPLIKQRGGTDIIVTNPGQIVP